MSCGLTLGAKAFDGFYLQPRFATQENETGQRAFRLARLVATRPAGAGEG